MVNHINIKSSAASFLDVVQMSQNSSQDLAINTGEIDYMPNAVAADGRIHELQEHHPNIRFRQVSVDLQGGISTYIFDADGLLTMTQLVSVRTEDESIVTTLISKSFRQAGKFNSTKSNAEETWTQSTQAKQRNIIKMCIRDRFVFLSEVICGIAFCILDVANNFCGFKNGGRCMDSNLQPSRAPVFKTSRFPIRLPSTMAAQIGIEPITDPLTAGRSTD